MSKASKQITFEQLTGRVEDHLTNDPRLGFLCHPSMVTPLLELQKAARQDGHEPLIVSCFRGHQRQLDIWNKKARGERPILDDQSNIISPSDVSAHQLMNAILRWSALPGTSRHHWGTDFDIVDKNAFPTPDYQVQLVPEEVEEGGIFAPFYDWLEIYLSKKVPGTFAWPYNQDRGGVAPERWHLSFAPTAREFFSAYSYDIFLRNLKEMDIELKDELLLSSDEVYLRFFKNINAI